ncbi:MAG TPA: DUF1801 domain-containing protein [Candidatus Dormibacteraeota bacterium]
MRSAAPTPEEYLAELDEPRRGEVAALDRLIRRAAPELAPTMSWGMLGYGPFHYRYASGREGDALAAQKRYLALYASCADDAGHLVELPGTAPQADIGKSCVRFRRIADVDLGVIEALVREAAAMGGMAAQHR